MSTSKSRKIGRREFIGEASCAAVGSTAFFSSLLALRMTGAAAAQSLPSASPLGDYKALVCIFLAGGNDSYNMLVPRHDEAYQQYAATREVVALPKEDLLPITTDGQAYSEFGLHPRLGRFQELYDDGNLAFISNVGALVRPTTLQDFNNKRSLPSGLFSHSDQQTHWQTCIPQTRGATGGWGGRASELLQTLNEDSKISMNISLSGLNVFQTGDEAFAFVTGTDGATEMVNYDNQLDRIAVDSLLTDNYRNLFQKTFAKNTGRFIDSSAIYNEALAQTNVSTLFPATRTGDRLKAVARSIAAHSALNMRRQTFFVKVGGWDHHSELNIAQDAMFPDLSGSLYSFWNALKELGLENDVVTFSASDFGRTLTPNTIGTDHAWGGNAFVMGGPVNGGKVYGTYPELVLGSNQNGNGRLDTNRGRLIPTTSVDEYCGELAQWFGVSNTDLDTVFPNIGNFYDPYSLTPPLGFLSSNQAV